MRLEVELWDAINSYAVTVGGNPSEHACGNVPRMQAVAAVNAIVAGVSSRQQVDDLTVEELARGHNAAAAAACNRGEEIAALRGKLRELDLAHKHLTRLYAESREYVDTLTRERDTLVEAAHRNVVEADWLDTELELMRPVYEAAKRMRAAVPADTAAEMRERGFHATTCDLVEAIDRAIASEPEVSPYRGAPMTRTE